MVNGSTRRRRKRPWMRTNDQRAINKRRGAALCKRGTPELGNASWRSCRVGELRRSVKSLLWVSVFESHLLHQAFLNGARARYPDFLCKEIAWRVRFPRVPPSLYRGISSIRRAPHLQCGGSRGGTDMLHQFMGWQQPMGLSTGERCRGRFDPAASHQFRRRAPQLERRAGLQNQC